MEYSIGPDGERFKIPERDDYEKEYERLDELVKSRKEEGFEIVVVMGLGFVGAVMAGVVADSVDKEKGKPNKYVIGMQRPSIRSFWKIPLFNRGVSPIEAEDPEVSPLIERCVNDKETLTATFTYDALKLADVLVVDVQCDFVKEELGNLRSGHADISALEESFKIMGEKISPRCLVLIETTVPPGTTEYVAYPIIKKAFKARGIDEEPLLAHSFERVMPGREYVRSVRDFWRVCSGINQKSREKVTRFLSEVLNVDEYPLTVLDRPLESETCKIVENSYRATILAFLDEWSLFAETNGVDLTKVINAIKIRPTHSNIIFPGPGIGGYCLPKDGGLGHWAYKHLMGFGSDI
ncbi:MAG: GDP-mannose dehydrogenase, partial [Thermodesulfobacteriota bacterium]|nr:GDP-mannose dehydrogenase [Thermodesulfobacteriota bacterium]